MKINNDAEAARALYNSIRPMILRDIKSCTGRMVESQRAVIADAPNSKTKKVGVQLPFDDKIMYLPYSSIIENLSIGAQVTILMPGGGGLSNGVVVQNGSWTL